MKRLLSLAALAAVLAAGTAQAQMTDGVIKIGVMNDMSGTYADLTGPGSVVAAQMAVEDFGAAVGSDERMDNVAWNGLALRVLPVARLHDMRDQCLDLDDVSGSHGFGKFDSRLCCHGTIRSRSRRW